MKTTSSLPWLAVVVLGGLLLFIITVQTAWSVAVILNPVGADYGEAIVYGVAARLVRGEPLYQSLDRPPHTVAAYTPLYYWLAAGLQSGIGPGFGPGRSVSFIAGLAAAGLVAYMTAWRTGYRSAGAFAALAFLALGLPWLYLWSALYRVDLLGVALSLGAVATLLGGTTRRRLVIGGLLAGLAFLTKQTLIAAGVAGAVWLWRRDRSQAALFAAAGSILVLTTSAALEVTTGAFLANVIWANVNPFSVEALVENLRVFALFQGGPVVVAMLYFLDHKRSSASSEDELLACYWGMSALPLAGLAKFGSSQNYWIEFAAITAVLASLGIWFRLNEPAQRSNPGRAIAPVLGFGVTLVSVTLLVGGAGLPASYLPGANSSSSASFNEVIERVRTEPGEVLAEPLDVVVLAGRPILLEPTIFGILYEQGSWDASPLVGRICAGEVGLVVLGNRIEHRGGQHDRYAHWPPPVLRALSATMVLETDAAGRFLYVPRNASPNVACGENVSGSGNP